MRVKLTIQSEHGFTKMLDKLEAIKERFDEVSQLIVDLKLSDMKNTKICSQFSLSNIETAKEMLKDEGDEEMAVKDGSYSCTMLWKKRLKYH